MKIIRKLIEGIGGKPSGCAHNWVRADHYYANVILAPDCIDYVCSKCPAKRTEPRQPYRRAWAA